MLGKAPILLLFLLSVSLSATVYGTVYDWTTLEPVKGSIISVNSTPAQNMVSTDGNYSFTLAPGAYEITARHYHNNTLAFETDEKIVILDDGSYILDLILFPTVDLGDPFFDEELPELDDPYGENMDLLTTVLFSMALAAAIIFVAIRLGRKKEQPAVADKPAATTPRLPKESREVLEIIQNEQRMTQKELRKKLPWSEAKVSLVVADLEERGMIQKIKKGRGNILKPV